MKRNRKTATRTWLPLSKDEFEVWRKMAMDLFHYYSVSILFSIPFRVIDYPSYIVFCDYRCKITPAGKSTRM